MNGASALPRLLLITDPDSPRGVVAGVQAAVGALEGPRVLVQLRAKDWPVRCLVEAGRALHALLAPRRIPLVVNARADVVLAIGAEGVHLPERGLRPSEARELLGPEALVGRSCHDRAGLLAAFDEGASYATLGPVGEVPGKGAPLGLDGFEEATHGIPGPVFGLGGVDRDVARTLRARGAHGAAAIRSISLAADPAAAVREFLYALEDAEA